MKFKQTLHRVACTASLLCTVQGAQAAINCSLSANGVTGTYTSAAATNLTGSVTVNCTRLSTDSAATATYYMNLDQGEPPNGRNMTRQTGTELLTYSIFRNSNFTGSWTTGAGRNPGLTNTGGLNVTINWAGSTVFTTTIPYYFRVAAGINRVAGIYDDVPTFGIYPVRNGTLLGSASFTSNVSIVSQCFFNTAPTTLTVNYTSFAATLQTGISNYSLSCTLGTNYSMVVTPASGTLLGLNYTLALSPAATAGTAFVQNYTATATLPAGQAGTCNTASCTATQPTTVTITY